MNAGQLVMCNPPGMAFFLAAAAASKPQLAERNRLLLELYRAGTPYHEELERRAGGNEHGSLCASLRLCVKLPTALLRPPA